MGAFNDAPSVGRAMAAAFYFKAGICLLSMAEERARGHSTRASIHETRADTFYDYAVACEVMARRPHKDWREDV